MIKPEILSQLKYYIASQAAYLKDPECFRVKHKPFVTISRQTGAGGITIGRKLAETLDSKQAPGGDSAAPWTVFDKELLDVALKEHQLPRRLGDGMPEDTRSEMAGALEELFGSHPSSSEFFRETCEIILHLAYLGQAVIVGRGAPMITKSQPGGYHVRLIGSETRRARRVKEYYGFSESQATEFLRQEDAARKDYIKKYFSKDIDDGLLYDLVINTDRISFEAAVEVITQGILARNKAALV